MEPSSQKILTKNLSPFGAWAFALGTSVGWGSLVVTSNSYLAQAGPLGSVLGLLAGMVVMLMISRNYACLMRIYPASGGAYTYSKEVFDHDYGFLTGWFLALVYLAILWANATAIPLFARNFLGGVLQFGRMYTLFGYDVYFGEVVVTLIAILLAACLCIRSKNAAAMLMIVLVCVFAVGITVVFIAGLAGSRANLSPAFVPDTDASALAQIVKIAVISPWAFIGFESISNCVEEFSFKETKYFRVLWVSVVSAAVLYIFVTLLSVTAYPERYGSWLAYIRDCGNLSGLEAFPAFYAAGRYMGSTGVGILMVSLLALVITSLIGNMTALSRLFYAMSRDGILPERFGRISTYGTPGNAIMLIAGVSVVIPFIGRTAIGWIVDVTTIGATLIYGFVSAAAMRVGGERGDAAMRRTGIAGLVIMITFGAYILVPTLNGTGSLEKETFFLFIVWSVLGFLFFRQILHRDKDRRFGNSMIVWVALLSMVLFIALIWIRQSMIDSDTKMIANVESYYEQVEDEERLTDEQYFLEEVRKTENDNTRTMIVAAGLFGLAIAIMMTNHSYLNRRAKESEMIANVDPMTGVKSKHAWAVKERTMDEAIGAGEAEDFSVVVCDVNGLKKINDTLGHKAGDEYIRSACRLVCQIFSHSPVYRIGGDEFVTVLTGKDFEIRRELMKLLHDRSVDNISAGGVVVSGGISDYVRDQDSNFHMIFERADALMYEEKLLLKGLGSITRDEDPVDAADAAQEEGAVIDARKQILIVEDETINQMLLGNALRDEYDTLFASDGVEALDCVKNNRDKLSLVLLDLVMPRMSGLEVLKKMKESQELRKIPVIVLTADQNAEVECLKIGAADFIPKPYPAWEIVRARVNRCIEISENRDLIQSTERDALTKLYNIEYFTRYVNMYDKHYQDTPMDAVVIDVNRFHMINERYGKSFGDVVLQSVGRNIRAAAREIGGFACRQTSDTFFLYCPHRGEEEYETLLEKISAGLTAEKNSADRVRLRMGVYSEADKSLDMERRFDRAKMASESVKSGRVKAVGIYNAEMHEQALFRERLLEDFHASIEAGCFKAYFQPKYDIRPEKPVLSSAEALVRWDHPELGMISPAVFIPVLEESGLILELDSCVWRQTAAQIRAWKDKFGFSIPVSVNVSRIDMLTPNLKDIFADILREYSLDTSDLVLEITESAYTGDSEQVISTARELRGMGMGFRIEMDDFGTGYSSLGMLTQLPIDALKLDMTFVRNAFGETRDVRMIELIIDIADYLHVPVVAEGVETEEQLLVLKALGCDLVQGYYFSRPVPGEEFEKFLVERGRQSLEVTWEARKSCMSISRALTYDFENIYYIDILTDYYLEFYAGQDGELQIRPGGHDFFADAEEKILSGVCAEDREKVRAAIGKANLLSQVGKEETEAVSYRKQKGEKTVPCCLQTIRTRSNDNHHVVIGVRPE